MISSCLQRISRGARNFGHDRELFLGQPIQQARLADIRLADRARPRCRRAACFPARASANKISSVAPQALEASAIAPCARGNRFLLPENPVSPRPALRSSMSAPLRRTMRCENSPASERIAPRAAASELASIRSATLSACARSSLPLRKARRVNSPGCAARAPSSRQRRRTQLQDRGPPCPCSSSTSSPV